MRKQNNPQFLPALKDEVSLRGVMNPKIKQLQDNVGATGHKVPTQKLLNAIKEVGCGDLVSYSSLDDFVKAFAQPKGGVIRLPIASIEPNQPYPQTSPIL